MTVFDCRKAHHILNPNSVFNADNSSWWFTGFKMDDKKTLKEYGVGSTAEITEVLTNAPVPTLTEPTE